MRDELEALGQQRAHHQLHPTWDRVWLGRFGDDIEPSGIQFPRRTDKSALIQLVRPVDEHRERRVRGNEATAWQTSDRHRCTRGTARLDGRDFEGWQAFRRLSQTKDAVPREDGYDQECWRLHPTHNCPRPTGTSRPIQYGSQHNAKPLAREERKGSPLMSTWRQSTSHHRLWACRAAAPSKHADSRIRKASEAIPRREFVPRDP